MTKRTVVEVQDLTVQFGDFKAVNRISFAVAQGEIFGFLGANGAGKTTTIRVLCGLLMPTHGQVEVAGIAYKNQTSGLEIKKKVGYMSQKFTLYNDLTVEENLQFTAALRKISSTDFKRRRQELFDFIAFNQPTGTLVKNLSGGMKQQVSLAVALLHDPEIIFLDEPTAGVSAAARARFWELIKNLSARGKTIFVTSHYMDEVEQCHRIALMRDGELIALDSPVALKRKAFPHALFELTPARPVTLAEMETLRAQGYFESLQPYGLRFHAYPSSSTAWSRFMAEHGQTFAAREILPTLEDVFIRLVEHQKP